MDLLASARARTSVQIWLTSLVHDTLCSQRDPETPAIATGHYQPLRSGTQEGKDSVETEKNVQSSWFSSLRRRRLSMARGGGRAVCSRQVKAEPGSASPHLATSLGIIQEQHRPGIVLEKVPIKAPDLLPLYRGHSQGPPNL